MGNLFRRCKSVPKGSIYVIEPETYDSDEAIEVKETEVLKVESVIVTVVGGESYDKLFRLLPQESKGGRIAIFSVSTGQVLNFVRRTLAGEDLKDMRYSDGSTLANNTKQVLAELGDCCQQVGPGAVYFNFECSELYGVDGFVPGEYVLQYKELFLNLIHFLVKDYCCMTIFSNRSLEALIADWDEERFGPNPFKQFGEFKGKLDLAFDSEKLQSCPLPQLRTVGILSKAEEGIGRVKIKTTSETIVFTISEKGRQIAAKLDDPVESEYVEPYQLEVLSVAETICSPTFTKLALSEVRDKKDYAALCEIRGVKGLAGHVLLTYPPSERAINRFFLVNGKGEDDAEVKASPARGMILASCGHWSDLMKIDVNLKRLIEMEEAEVRRIKRIMEIRMQEEYMSVREFERERWNSFGFTNHRRGEMAYYCNVGLL